MSMDLVNTVTVGAGGASSIEFTNIPQTGKDLLVLFAGRSDLGGVAGGITIRYNNDSSTSYTWQRFAGDGSTASASRFASQSAITSSFSVNGSPATSNTFSNVRLHTSNYTSSIKKYFAADAITENNATEGYQVMSAGIWTGTAAITSLTISLSGTFDQNTIASLYIIY